jgi:DNA invertase Pin-like site-specific DNA recombinase
MGISIRAYARHRGVTDTAVHKAIRSGRVTPEADGTIDADQADAQWERNTSAPKTGTQRPVVKVKVPEVDGPERSSAGATGAANVGGSGGTSLLQARTVNEVVKAQTNKVRLARLKGELVDRPQAIAHVFKLARSERDAWLNWPARVSAQMAAKLEIDAHTMHVALESAVREHLQELGDLRPRVD